MTWKDLQARIRGLFGGRDGNTSHRPDGGTSCYRPVQRRNRQEERLAQEKAAEYAASQGAMGRVHTGFTGMNPPMTGAAPVQNTYNGGFRGSGPAQAAWPEGDGIAWPGNTAGGQGGYQPVFSGENQTGAQGSGAPWGAEAGGAADNISYMPGMYMPDAGSSYTHVEHVMAITSLRSCYEAIECMKNGETLIVTLDVLGSEGERIRCQDMLAGAAFTLRCTVRPLPGVGVILIAPATVKILPEQRRYEDAGAYAAPAQVPPVAAEETPWRRERRVSQNAVGWERAGRADAHGFNPYTGSMPTTTGSYSMYGGY